ncbi:MAG TPA: hypothetical protein VKE51_27135 [Vicinamibacterales bacterium]|nr:hypothetical protein [Vicinamibacterales bacterium]
MTALLKVLSVVDRVCLIKAVFHEPAMSCVHDTQTSRGSRFTTSRFLDYPQYGRSAHKGAAFASRIVSTLGQREQPVSRT